MPIFPLQDALGVPLPELHIVDVGASMVEGEDHYAPLVRRGLCRVTGFEPDPEQLSALEASGRSGYRYLPYALGAGGPATFHVARFPGCSSLFPPNADFIDRFTAMGASGPDGNFTVVDQVPIQTHKLDDVLDEAVDFLKLDIQGAERDVLACAPRVLSEALVIESEVLFVPLYEGQADMAELTLLLRAHGFQLLELRDVHRRSVAPFLAGRTPNAPVGQWTWADALFVKRYADVSDWSETSLLKAATVLHEVYQVCDLVHHLLIEVQLRTGVPVSDRYRLAIHQDPDLRAFYPVVRQAWHKALRRTARGKSAKAG